LLERIKFGKATLNQIRAQEQAKKKAAEEKLEETKTV